MEDRQGLWDSPIHRQVDSSSSTPYESAICSPRSSTDRTTSRFFSASTPTCPVKVTLNIESSAGLGFMTPSSIVQLEEPASDDFDFSARFSEADHPWSMSSADELFYNGQIRPLWYPSEDLAHLYSAHSEHTDGDDSHFDFQSSADYKFTMLSLHQSHVPALNEGPQYGGHGCKRQYRGQEPEYTQGFVRHVNADDTRAKGDGVKETAESLLIQTSMPQDVDVVVKHAMKVKVEECRGRRAGISSIRRTRSLSPLRVFHMDDEAPRQSVEDNQSFESARAEQEEKREGDEIVRRKGVRLTLKELLHASELADRGSVNERQAWLGSKYHGKAYMETKLHESSAFRPRFSPKNRLEDSTKGPNHVLGVQAPRSPRGSHYSSPKFNSEHTRRQTFLPYRHGLLACLGFTSKSYRSVAGIRSLHSKSQGMR